MDRGNCTFVNYTVDSGNRSLVNSTENRRLAKNALKKADFWQVY